MATFGKTDIGSTSFSMGANAVHATAFAPLTSGTATSMTFCGADSGDAAKGVLFAADGTVLAVTTAIALGTTMAWVSGNFVSPVSIVGGTTYYLGIVGQVTINGKREDTGGTSLYHAYNDYAAPQSIAGATAGTRLISIYVTYTDSAPAVVQEGYRWRLDDGTEATATWADDQDISITAPSNATRRVRLLLDTSGDANAAAYRLDHKEANDANYSAVSNATAIQYAASSYIAANAATNTTGQLTPPFGKTAVGYFQAGRISDDTNPLPSVNLIVNTYTELEWALTATNAALQNGTYSFRVTANGTALDAYAVTPTLIVLDAANATLAQTLGSITLTATAEIHEPGTAVVDQTLQPLGQDITGSTGRAAEVNQTLGSMSRPGVFCDTASLGGGTPTGFNFYFGRASGVPTQIVSKAYTANLTVLIADIAPEVGEWYVRASAYNSGGETSLSNEVFVVVPTITATVEDVSGVAVVTQTLGSLACAARATVDVTADVTQTLGDLTPAITAATGINCTVAQTLEPVTCVATMTSPQGTVEADVTQTLGDLSIQATASVYEAGSATAWVDALLGEIQSTITGTVAVTADVSQTLEPMTCAAVAYVGFSLNPPDTSVYIEGTLWRS